MPNRLVSAVPPSAAPRKRAAAYMRMSTERQNYSIQHQSCAINDYALCHGIEVIKTYVDSGKSGLRINGRTGLKNLIDDVLSGSADFEIILVYDVSRWGRFQDADESAYYEFICRRAGIGVVYCAELFADDDSPMGAVLKSLKRLMASEYSRELSAKVFAAQSNFTLMGFKQGGHAGYGLRRLAVDQARNKKTILRQGERKPAQTDRIVLVPGPGDEAEVVHSIYDWYTRHKLGDSRIALMLNVAGIPSESGKPWTKKIVRSVLTNEKYIGNAVYNRTSYKLKKHPVKNPRHMWIRKDAAFPALVPAPVFDMAQAERQQRHRCYTDTELLDILREVHAKHGKVTALLISARGAAPTPQTFKYHFGTLANAYSLAGVACEENFSYVESRRALRAVRSNLVAKALELIASVGGSATPTDDQDTLRVNGALTLKIMAIRCQHEGGGLLRWRIKLGKTTDADFVIAAQMDKTNRQVLCFYLLPMVNFDGKWLPLPTRFDAPSGLSQYRYATLEAIFGIHV